LGSNTNNANNTDTIITNSSSSFVDESAAATAASPTSIDAAIVGGAVGGGVALLVLALLVTFCVCKTRKSKQKQGGTAAETAGQSLSQLDLNMSSARHDGSNSNAYGSISDAASRVYDVGNVPQLSQN
jgi:hypothetical protein